MGDIPTVLPLEWASLLEINVLLLLPAWGTGFVARGVEDCVLHWHFGAFSFWFEVGAVCRWYIATSPGRSCAVAGAERRRTRENRTLPEEEIEEGADLPVPAPLPAWWVSIDLLWRS